jgi:serine/threonine protein kinase
MIGTTLSSFNITAKLGEGGMGEVYRAEDTKLGRDVAIKVLPEAVAGDPERLARFEREAKVLAALDHPSIAAIYGLEEVDGRQLLIMQLAEGETLQERIAKGPVPLDQALPIALQIAEAVEAAHEKGIIHRDLKPANVKVTSDGQVKVLDFGLAKALEEEHEQGDIANSPTLTAAATQAGLIMGTAGYMSPEQASAQMADRRADVWSFGVVLAEMISGQQQFGGETVSHVLAAVLQKDPDWDQLPDDLPRPIAELLRRCMRKDPKQRLQAIGDARVVIQDYMADPASFAVEAPAVVAAAQKQPRWKTALPWALVVLAAIAVASLSLRPEPPSPILKATIPPPDSAGFHLNGLNPGPAVFSPDGSKIAFSATATDGVVRLYVRSLGASQAHLLSGTEGAQYPFWSPDSRWLGFFTQVDGTLKKIDSAGGPPMTLCEAADGKGGAWNREGVILFAPNSGDPIHRVSAAGGESEAVTEIDEELHNSHRHPRFLPDGRRFLFMARGDGAKPSAVMAGSLDGEEPRPVVESPIQAEFASGHLLFARDSTLMARPFDPDKLEFTDEAIPLAEDVLRITAASLAVFSSSENGNLLYQTGSAVAGTSIEWRELSGQVSGSLGDPAVVRTVMISPDNTMAAVVQAEESGAYDIWMQDIERDLRTRFTFDPGVEFWPAWSSDNQYLYFYSDREGTGDIYRKAVGGVGEVELVYSSERDKFPSSLSPDGRYLAYTTPNPDTQMDLFVLPLEEGAEPFAFRQTEFAEGVGMISPDGRWITYTSNESGDWQVYVSTFPEPGRRWQVSTNPASYAFWRADGRQLIYSELTGNLVSVEVDPTGETFQIGQSQPLFPIAPSAAGGAWFSTTSNADRILVVPNQAQQGDNLLNLVVNWPAELEQRK